MSISESLLPEFDMEMASARKTLERVPQDKLDFRPHPKSGTMGWLATHLAHIPTWGSITIHQDTLDLAPGNPGADPPPLVRTTAQLLDTFDRNVAEARAALAGATDAHLTQPWSLVKDGKPMLTMPRVAVLRSFILNHLIHHRAQLGVYLRMNDVPVPSIYGPSADENPMGM